MLASLQHLAMTTVDGLFACLPRPLPGPAALQACKIIAHRGEHDNRRLLENTLPAFRAAADAGVWGLEADIRWTRDLVPVITHDADGSRLFDDSSIVADLDFTDLRQRLPQIPSLEELVGEFGGRQHLMLEIKDEVYPDLERQQQILQQQLADLQPGLDYHFLALDPLLFEKVDFLARRYCYPVAELNPRQMSRAALALQLGGLTGHFLLLSRAMQARHEQAGQSIGTGFVSSRNVLFRELNRGVEWIFSNDAVKLQGILERARSH